VAHRAKRSRLVVVAYYLLKDFRARLEQRVGAARINVQTGGHAGADLGAYAEQAFHEILRYTGLTPQYLEGKRVLEIGPGNNLGTATLMRQHGASEVVALERFVVGVNGGTAEGLTFTEGVAIEEAAQRFGEDRFDLIYSVAVLEHVGELDAAVASMYRLLAPGGIMVHKIGGGDHGMFTGGGRHPLTYMTVPAPLYRLMTARSGGPNRVLPIMVKRMVERYDWAWELAVTDTLDLTPADVEAIRPRLREPFRSLPTSELLVQTTFLTVRKVSAPGRADAVGSQRAC
jgi:SAM-dependent methyltransferase